MVSLISISLNEGLKFSFVQNIFQNTYSELQLGQKIQKFLILARGLRYSNLLITPFNVTQVIKLNTSQIFQAATQYYLRIQLNTLIFRLHEVLT